MSKLENTCCVCSCPQCAARDNAVRLALLDELTELLRETLNESPGPERYIYMSGVHIADLRKKYGPK